MITRFRANGFKNLMNIDIRFGPFTCIAGENGVGKSNLFDAIRFLSSLADQTFLEAASSIRDDGGRAGDIQALFHREGAMMADHIEFDVEMIIPSQGTDDLGQSAEATATLVRYQLTLGLTKNDAGTNGYGLVLQKEELTDIKKRQVSSALSFPHSREWQASAIRCTQRASPFISTEGSGDDRIIKLHQERRQGRAAQHMARKLPRTVLSATTAGENPTALLARREMQSWRLLQLEPSALRKPDELNSPSRISANGRHLPATLDRLSRVRAKSEGSACERVASRLQDLISDVAGIQIDRDEKRELLTLLLTDRQGTSFPARALSDGTLRFLALCVIELDPEAQGVLCLEEPENGIHPKRLPAMLELLRDIAVDTKHQVGSENPLRQVIVNTHSPGVVAHVDPDDLLFAKSILKTHAKSRSRRLQIQFIGGTWREKSASTVTNGRTSTVSPGDIVSYLESSSAHSGQDDRNGEFRQSERALTVRDYVQGELFYASSQRR